MNLLTPYKQFLSNIISATIKEHIVNRSKISSINFIERCIPYTSFRDALDIFNNLSEGVNICARWKDDDSTTGILEIYDYKRI